VAAAAVAGAALFAGAGSVSAQGGGGGGGGGGQQQPADPPAIAYRKAMMNNNAQHLGAMRAILNGDLGKAGDLALHAQAVANNGAMWATMWPAGSTGAQSRAMDEIWSKPDEFAARVKAFQDATAALPAIVAKGDKAASLAQLQAIQGTCGACHMPFRKPAPPATR
jgi:cytochrome c556